MRVGKVFGVVLVFMLAFGQVWAEDKQVQVDVDKVSKTLKVDISKLSQKAQDEFINIYKEFKKNNPTKNPQDYNPYWQNIFEAVKIKNEITGDLGELKKGKQAIEKAVSQAGIAHSPRGAEGNVYRYFKDKVKFIERGVNGDLLELVLKGEQEFRSNIKNGKDGFFYTFLNYLTGTNIRVGTTKRLKKYSPNFYTELSSLLISKKSNLVFSDEFYSIVKHEESARKHEERAKMLKKVADELRKSL